MENGKKPRDLLKVLGLGMFGNVFSGAARDFHDERETLDHRFKRYPDIGLSPEIKLSPFTCAGETFYRFVGDFGDNNIPFAKKEAEKFGIKVEERAFPDGVVRHVATVKSIEQAMATHPYGTSREEPGGPPVFHFYNPNPNLQDFGFNSLK